MLVMKSIIATIQREENDVDEEEKEQNCVFYVSCILHVSLAIIQLVAVVLFCGSVATVGSLFHHEGVLPFSPEHFG